MRCAVANFKATNGILTAQNIVFDTGPVIAEGSGTVSLRDETDLRIQGHAKEARLVRLMAPITLQGPIRSPKLGVDKSKAAGQIGLAAAFGTLLTPIAAILPFVDPGLSDDADAARCWSRPARKAHRQAFGDDA
ncbi:MAG: hypothetical protein WDN76_01585 [Alphaproteobacteria bacterium]